MARRQTDRRIDKKVNVAKRLGINVPDNATYGNWWRRLPNDTRKRVLDSLESMPTEKRTRRGAPVNKGVKQTAKRTQLRGGLHVSARTIAELEATLRGLGDTEVALQIDFRDDPRFISTKTVSEDVLEMDVDRNGGKGTSSRNREQLTDEVQFWAPNEVGIPASWILELRDHYGNLLDALWALWLAAKERS